MKSFLQRRDPWGHGISLWLIAAVVFLLPLMGWSVRGIRLENDVAGWLPQNDPQSRILDWYQKLFPSEERLLVSWDDCSLTDHRMPIFAQKLNGIQKLSGREGGSPLIADVRLPHDLLKRMMKENIPFATAMQRIQGLMIGEGPICIRLTDAGRMRGEFMQKEILRLANEQFHLNAVIVQQAMPLPSSEGLDIEDEASWKLNDAITSYIQSQPLFDLQLRWPGMHIATETTEAFRQELMTLMAPDGPDGGSSAKCIDSTFYIPGSMAAVSIALNDPGAAEHSAVIRDVLAAAEFAGIPREKLRLGGRPVASSALNTAVKHAGWNRDFPVWDLPHRSPILLSALVTVVLSLIVLRSLRLTILVQTVSLLCALAAVSLVPATGGSMNMVLVVMPTLLVVLTTSAAIHLCNYWKNSGINNASESVYHAAAVAWMPCALASFTTAIGLASLTVSSLIPVRDFGIYASVGCGMSFFCALYLLPSLMLYWPQKPPHPESVDTSTWRWLGTFISTHRYAVTAVCLLTAISCGYGLTRFRTETKVIRYFPDDAQVVMDYNFLEENLSGIVSVDTIVKFDVAAQQQIPFMDRARKVMEVQDALREHPEVSGTLSLASFLDLSAQDSAAMTRMQRMQLKRKESLIGDRIHQKLAAGGSEAAGLVSLLAVAAEDGDWKEPGDVLLNRKGDELWRITCQSSIMSDYDYGKLTHELDQITRQHLSVVPSSGTGHIVTGLIPIFLRTQQALLESLISSFGLAFVVIWVVMTIQLRNALAAAFAMLPNLMPVAVMFGLLSWYRIRIDIGTMITASVALGIAVDGTLHLITWFQSAIREGLSRREAVTRSLEHCGPALWQTSAAVGIGMLSLYPVELLLISRFGWIMAGMIFAALIGDVILLPALLAGPLGALLERSLVASRRRNKTDAIDDSAATAAAVATSASSAGLQLNHDGNIAASTAQTLSGREPVVKAHPHFNRISTSVRNLSGES